MEENRPLLSVDQTDDGIHVVKLLPRQILAELQIAEISQGLKDLVDAGARRLVLDFSNVDHFSSSALGMLITTKKLVEGVQGGLRLWYIRSQIFKVFKITRLDEVFAIHKTAGEALEGFRA